MKRRIWPVLLVLVSLMVVGVSFGIGGDDEPDTPVVLDEEDLMEQVEIWRNQYRRMTPGDGPLVQDVGELPAAWEEFGNRWSSAPAERDLATWLMPFSAERQGDTTVIRDAGGTVLWSGTTDFAKPDSTNVTLTGALVDEADWPLYSALRAEVAGRLAASRGSRTGGNLRDGEGGGTSTNNPGKMFVSAYSVFTNGFPELHLGLQWTNDVTLDIFAFAPLHTWVTNVVTWTNDENLVVTTTNVSLHSSAPGLTGLDSAWRYVGTVSLTNGEAEFVDTHYSPERWAVRFYAAFEAGDADGDGLNDVFEIVATDTSPNNPDDDGDGVPDGLEQRCGTVPSIANVWWKVSTTNIWEPWVHFMGCSNSWNANPVHVDQLHYSIDKPADVAVLHHAWMSGWVDDAIKIDGNAVQWVPDVKEFDHEDVAEFIEDVERGDFRVDIFDWPIPGYDGCNEVRLGTTNNPFRIEWEWSVPLDVRMEPIWTSATLPLDNPSGIIQGSNAWFHVDVLPANVVPETNIFWEALGTNLVLTPTNRGSRVQVLAAHEGDEQLQVTVEGTQGAFSLPPFHVKVVPLTVVTAKVGVVVSTNQTVARSDAEIRSFFQEANSLLLQLGLQIEALEPFVPIPDEGGFFNVVQKSAASQSLRSKLSQPGGMEVYFVGDIHSPQGDEVIGCNTPTGILLGHLATGRALAHETGHACGFRDVYDAHSGTGLHVEGGIEESMIPSDWGRYVSNDGTVAEAATILWRLLMFGFDSGTNADIPTGWVRGLAYFMLGVEPDWMLEEVYLGYPWVVHWPHHN